MSGIDEMKVEVEAARFEVVESDKEISRIRTALRTLTSQPPNDSETEEYNSLVLSVEKVTGLPDAAKPTFNVQLSSPIEEQDIKQIFDPLNPEEEEAIAKFRGVDTSVATVVVKVSDSNNLLGSSAVHDVKPLCEIDVLGGVTKFVTELEIAIVPDNESLPLNPIEEHHDDAEDAIDTGSIEKADTEDEFQDAKSEVDETKTSEDGCVDEPVSNVSDIGETEISQSESKSADNGDKNEKTCQSENVLKEIDSVHDEMAINAEKDAAKSPEKSECGNTSSFTEQISQEKENNQEEHKIGASTLLPTCVVYMRVEYRPSTKDQKDKLYDLLSKASKRKAKAVDKLRKSAAALNRSKPDEAIASKKDNKAVKSGFLNKNTQGKKEVFLVRWYKIVRGVFPIAKNYILFFSGVAIMHFQGQQLALPPPV